jgi:hypothetical protein
MNYRIAGFVGFVAMTGALAWGQTPTPTITPSAEGPGTEAGKQTKPGSSWSEAAKSGGQANDGTGGHPAPACAKQKAAESRARADGGPLVIPPPAAK